MKCSLYPEFMAEFEQEIRSDFLDGVGEAPGGDAKMPPPPRGFVQYAQCFLDLGFLAGATRLT